jgi:hypothetical protein
VERFTVAVTVFMKPREEKPFEIYIRPKAREPPVCHPERNRDFTK